MRAFFFTIGLSLVPSIAHAATLQVGPGKPYAKPCDAIAAAQPGDVIEVDASGHYDGDTCSWSTDDLTVRGVNGRAKIDDTGVAVAEKKGIFVVHAPNATIESFELSGAAISAADGNNGAGIRHQGTNLTVRNCYLHDDQDGILGAPPTDGQGSVVIEGSEFANNGAGDGQSHNMYLNHYASFTLRYSYSHGAKVGHLVKSRALESLIAYNRLTDEAGTTASYEIDLPSAGTAYVIGNVIEQSAASQNHVIVTYGEEGATLNPDTHLFVVNNTILNDANAGTFVNVATATPALLENNVFFGPGTITNQGAAVQTTNFAAPAMGDPMFVDLASFDVRPKTGSPLIDKGTLPGANGGQSLAPDHEYVHPLMSQSRAVVGSAIDIGAYEYGNTGVTPDGGAGAPDAGGGGGDGGPITTRPDSGIFGDDAGAGNGATGGDSGGCGCVTAGSARASWLAVIGALVLALAARARRRR